MKKQRLDEKISDDLMTCRGASNEIPLDLIPKILTELPVKTLARVLCVSKQYLSIIRNRDFVKSYLIKSSTRPQKLIFTFAGRNSGKYHFFSVPQHEDRSSPMTVLTHLMSCPAALFRTVAPSVHGLICHGYPDKLWVSNPSTRKSIVLPKIDSKCVCVYHHLGYDPIDGDYKVLCMVKGMHVDRGRYLADELRVLTLRKDKSWRMIQDVPPHCLCTHDTPDICIDGVLYYVALFAKPTSHAVMTFDVRSEKFDLIEGPDPFVRPMMTRYEGKPALVFAGIADCRVNVWVLEDPAKHEWFKMSYVCSTARCDTHFFHHILATNDAGEVVYAPDLKCSKPYDVLFYHPKKKTMRSVLLEGICGLKVPLWDKDSYHNLVSVFPGHVDNPMLL